MASSKSDASSKTDVEQKRRQAIDKKQEHRGPTQEVTGGPGSEPKQQSQEADGQLSQDKKNRREEQARQQGGSSHASGKQR